MEIETIPLYRVVSSAPSFASLRADHVNLRRGPGLSYPIAWVLHRRHLPVEIIQDFDVWTRLNLYFLEHRDHPDSAISTPIIAGTYPTPADQEMHPN